MYLPVTLTRNGLSENLIHLKDYNKEHLGIPLMTPLNLLNSVTKYQLQFKRIFLLATSCVANSHQNIGNRYNL